MKSLRLRLGTLACLVALAGVALAAEPSRPNVLFILADDLGERTNLAAKEPARVKHLDALIEKFLADTKAVVPIANSKFDPCEISARAGRPAVAPPQ